MDERAQDSDSIVNDESNESANSGRFPKKAAAIASACGLVVVLLVAAIIGLVITTSSSIHKLETKVQALTQQLDAKDGDTKLTLSQVNSKVNSLNGKISDLEAKDKHLSDNIDSIEACVNRYMDVVGKAGGGYYRYNYCFTF